MRRAAIALVAIVVTALAFKALQSRLTDESETMPRADAGRPRNVLLITLDTTRADRIGAYGYGQARTPILDALARDGMRFADATAVSPITAPSHAAMLTGMYPGRHAVRDNATTPLPGAAVTLAEVLTQGGYATGGFIGAFILDRPYGFAQGFETFDSGFTRVESGRERNAERPARSVVDSALAWLRALPDTRPFFAWVHLYDPHAPYDHGYDGELATVDREIGRLLEGLRTRGVLDQTLIMAIADHGESLGEHGEDEHGVFLYESVLRVPWIVRGPGVKRGHVVAEQVRGIDLFPTVLDALGIREGMPAGLDGESLWPLLRGETRVRAPEAYAESYYPRFHYGWSELRAIRADGWKAIDAPRPELYNLRDDPSEQRNLYTTERTLADRMIAEAARVDRAMGGGQTVAVTPPDRETLERLRSLGYVGAVSRSPKAAGERGPDPKDRIEQRRQYTVLVSEAIDDLRANRANAAVAKLQRLVRDNTQSYDLHELLGEAYQRQGSLEKALGEYEMAALVNPQAASPRLSAAEAHLARRDLAAARRALDAAARIDPESFDVALVRGRVLEAEGQLPAAASAYEKAIAANPANPRARMLLATVASRTGRHDVAEAQLRTLLDMGYQPARTHLALGRLAQLRGANPDAAAHYREALRLEPGLAPARQGLASLGVR